MRKSSGITTFGMTVSAILAIFYVVLMLASLFLVGLLTTGSWQAVFLGAGWPTVLGLEIGLAAIAVASFVIAAVFVLVYNAILRRVTGQPANPARSSLPVRSWARSWQARSIVACGVVPPLALFGLGVLASAGTPQTDAQGSRSNAQPANLGSIFNSAYRETEPSFTADGKTMYFNCFSGDICVSYLTGTWEEGDWSPPERLAAPINTAFEEIEPVISPEGDKLYFTSVRPARPLWSVSFFSPFMNAIRFANTLATGKLGRSLFGGLGFSDVYVSYRVGGAWSEPRNLNDADGEPPINTAYHDHCLFFSADGDEAFWTSTRPGGFGENDIWTSRRVDGRWTEPENLGPNVNGPGTEHTSIPTPDGRSLYITTTRAEGFGKEDIYISRRGADGVWGPLVNLGLLVNGPGDDRCPAWTPDLRIFLFDSIREGGFGGRDIWWVYFEDVMGYP